jgi:chromosome segregation protein
MKLKKLDIVGFKSFFEKASIAFPPGISAVVGPNGCGKSNIVDALRWVMGEQSVKQLRGKDKADIIFAGANGKPPTNMAEVSVTLINDNGSAPEELKDFSEIMVTRRLFRSGESAYLINKQPCRLKDIHNIFMGSGMGARTYAVIQQGNIGAITDAGPDERRYFIEEAAGVTRYKARKAETLRKVKATNQNLLRVNDIISEVNRQMAGLNRQAKKAERYKKIQKRIAFLDTRLILNRYDEYSHQIEATNALLKEFQDSDIEHTTQLKKIDAAIEDIKQKRWEKNQEISAQKSKRFDTQRRVDRLETELSHHKKDVVRLGQEADELEQAQKELSQKNESIDLEVSQVERRTDELKQEITEVETLLQQEQNGSKILRDQLAECNELLDKHKNNLMNIVAEEARYKNIYQTTSSNRDNLKRRLKRIDEEEILAGQKVASTREAVDTVREEIHEIEAELLELSEIIDKARVNLDEKTASLGEKVKQSQGLELEHNTTKAKLTTLNKMADNFEWYKDGVKTIMQARFASGDTLGDCPELACEVLGLMADVIEPTPSYSTAVEVVLGESLQYVLVKDLNDGLMSVKYLQENSGGRSGFIPMDTIKPANAFGAHMPEESGLLINHVKIKPGYEKIVQALLGHVTVANDILEAQEIFNRNGSFQTVVTLEGDIISPQGIVIGGSKENLAGILAKKQELKELAATTEKLENQLKTAREEQTVLESEVRDAEVELQQYFSQKSQILNDQTEAEKSLYKAEEDLKNAKRHLEIVRLEQEQLLGEENDIHNEIEKYDKALARITEDVKKSQDNVSDMNRRITELSSDLETYNQKSVDLKLRLTSCGAEMENSLNTLKRLHEFRTDGLKRLEQIKGEISQKRVKKQDLKKRISDHDELLASMYTKIQHLEEKLSVSESDYDSIDEKLKHNDGLVSEIQSRREGTLKKIRLLELELSEKKIKQENVVNRCDERYHCSIEALRKQDNLNGEAIDLSNSEIEVELDRFRTRISRMGDVNLGAIEEYRLLKERYDFLTKQRDDLIQAIEDLHQVISKINKVTQERFLKTFNAVNQKLKEVFPKLFLGGEAWLELTEPNNPLETGVEYLVHPAGKKITRMSLLSGGEKALSAIAFIFSIFLIKPTSFCLMDEIDAPLDDANVNRFNELLKIIGEKSQVIMITHNKHSMEFADTLFGITMEQKGISKIVSVNLN